MGKPTPLDLSPKAKAETTTPTAAPLVFEKRLFDADTTPTNSPERKLTSHDSPMKRPNDLFAYCLMALVLCAPIPLGSNRPTPWAIWAAALAVLFCLYLVTISLRTPERPLQSARHLPIFALGGVYILCVGVQILPFLQGAQLPSGITPSTISLVPEASLLGALRLLSYGALFALTLEVATQRKRIRHMGWILFAGLVAHAVWAMLALTLLGDQFLWGEKTAYLGAATGTFINRNSFATFMGMGLVLGVALTANFAHRPPVRHPNRNRLLRPGVLENLALGLCLLMIVIALISSQSRMGVAASAFAALTTYLLVAARHIGWMNAAKRGATIAIPLVLLFVVLFGQDLLERSLFVAHNGETRLTLWHQTLTMIADRPLTGFGLDSFAVAFEQYHRPGLASEVTWEYAHSSYLALWAELGLVAGSLPLLALGIVGARLIQNYRQNSDPLCAAALGVLVLGATHSLVDFSLEIEANTFLFLVILALGLSPARQRSKK
jgi:O-antigen ligase